jgi:UDP-glucose:O-linked fucose beta-1,3-glucosyltransferase
MITVTYLGADFNTILGHCNKTEAILRHFALNGRANNWKWLVIADDDTILSVAKLMDAIQCYDKVQYLMFCDC